VEFLPVLLQIVPCPPTRDKST